jgi:hypothetical protein
MGDALAGVYFVSRKWRIYRSCAFAKEAVCWDLAWPCAYEDSLLNVVVGNDPVAVNFICPQIRDSDPLDGGYAIYTAPIWPIDALQSVVSVETSRN